MGTESFTPEAARYRRLTNIISMDPVVRARVMRLGLFGLGVLGVLLILPVLTWKPVDGDPGESEFFRRPTPYEAHFLEVARAALGATDAGKRWLDEGFAALDAPSSVTATYQRSGTLSRGLPLALAFAVYVEAGQRVRADLRFADAAATRIFIDTFRRSPIPGRRPVQISSSEANGLPWVLEPSDAGAYVIRIQPEYGAAGTYQLVFAVEASFFFPIPGHGMRDVGSLFGDPRDWGLRRHNGVDIFAPRGTPVIAATDGVILAVDDTRIGGRVVWLRASGGCYAVYYAHLDRQLVQEGQEVCAGDTLGLVGNTGNARTTPPHLHLGIYRRGGGAVDPWYFIAPVEPHGSSASHSTGTSR